MSEKQIIVINEKWYHSIIKDTYTFGGLIGVTYFNEVYLGASSSLNMILLLILLVFLLGSTSKTDMQKFNDEEMIEYLSEKHKIKE